MVTTVEAAVAGGEPSQRDGAGRGPAALVPRRRRPGGWLFADRCVAGSPGADVLAKHLAGSRAPAVEQAASEVRAAARAATPADLTGLADRST
jgi:hypothetical protein